MSCLRAESGEKESQQEYGAGSSQVHKSQQEPESSAGNTILTVESQQESAVNTIQESARSRTEESQQESEEDRLQRLQDSLDFINSSIKAKV